MDYEGDFPCSGTDTCSVFSLGRVAQEVKRELVPVGKVMIWRWALEFVGRSDGRRGFWGREDRLRGKRQAARDKKLIGRRSRSRRWISIMQFTKVGLSGLPLARGRSAFGSFPTEQLLAQDE